METHSSILAWEIPRIEEPGRLQSLGLKGLDITQHTSVICLIRLRNRIHERGGDAEVYTSMFTNWKINACRFPTESQPPWLRCLVEMVSCPIFEMEFWERCTSGIYSSKVRVRFYLKHLWGTQHAGSFVTIHFCDKNIKVTTKNNLCVVGSFQSSFRGDASSQCEDPCLDRCMNRQRGKPGPPGEEEHGQRPGRAVVLGRSWGRKESRGLVSGGAPKGHSWGPAGGEQEEAEGLGRQSPTGPAGRKGEGLGASKGRGGQAGVGEKSKERASQAACCVWPQLLKRSNKTAPSPSPLFKLLP